MPCRRLLSLVLLTACGDDGAAATGTTGGTGEPDTGDVLSAGQTSAPTDGTISGDPPEPTSSDSTAGSAASTTDPPTDCPDEIVLADPLLHAFALLELGLPEGPIPGDLAATLVTLTPAGEAFTLAGLECLPNLEVLGLAGGTISDLSPLAGLKKLAMLRLRKQQVVDLSPLAGLPELHDVDIDDNFVTDLSALATLPKLHTLNVTDNPLTSFEPLAGRPLVELYAARTAPADLDGLGDLKQLQILHMTEAGVTDIGPLAGATALVDLILQDNAIADLTPLAGAPKLQDLDLSRNAIVDLAPLGDLPALNVLTLDENMIFDPAPLAGLPALVELSLADNPLKPDLGALLALDDLVRLDLSRTDRELLHPFAPQTLTTLVAEGNALVDLAPLAGHTALRSIYLDDNAITTIEPILAAPFWGNRCVSLHVSGNPLGADTLGDHLPQLCQLATRIFWDQDSCDACPFQ